MLARFPLSAGGTACSIFPLPKRRLGAVQNLAGCGSAGAVCGHSGSGGGQADCEIWENFARQSAAFEAIGTERIESLCDVFSEDMRRQAQAGGGYEASVQPRLWRCPLALQRDIFHALDCARKIGLTLNDNLMMSPTKSVTAIIGITDRAGENKRKDCTDCDKQDCVFRKTDMNILEFFEGQYRLSGRRHGDDASGAGAQAGWGCPELESDASGDDYQASQGIF